MKDRELIFLSQLTSCCCFATARLTVFIAYGGTVNVSLSNKKKRGIVLANERAIERCYGVRDKSFFFTREIQLSGTECREQQRQQQNATHRTNTC